MFGKLLSTTALAGLVLTASCTAAAKGSQQQQAHVGPAVAHSGRGAASAPAPADRSRLVQEAVSALRETENALTAIDRKKPDLAIAALERATGKLEIVLARSPDLALAPVEVSTRTYDVIGTVENVEKVRTAARAAMDQGRLQDARRLISNLASETVVSVSNLPLATYPGAIKQAAALLHQGRSEEAKGVLETALGTIVVENTIIPLPLVRAQAAIDQARGLSEKANRTEAEAARLRSLLDNARSQLRLGQALGYATEKDMNNLLAAVDDLDRKTRGQRHASGLVDRFQGLFETARRSSQTQKAQGTS